MAETTEQIPVKKVKGRVKLLQVMPYRGCPIYVKQVDEEIFMYDLILDNQIYFDYIIMKPEEGKKKLNDKQTRATAAMVFTAATVTIDEVFKLKEKQLLSQGLPKTTIKKGRPN